MGVKFSLEVIEDLRKSKMIDPTVIKIKKVIQKKIINLLEPLEKKNTNVSMFPEKHIVKWHKDDFYIQTCIEHAYKKYSENIAKVTPLADIENITIDGVPKLAE